jgi:hypothetical protein
LEPERVTGVGVPVEQRFAEGAVQEEALLALPQEPLTGTFGFEQFLVPPLHELVQFQFQPVEVSVTVDGVFPKPQRRLEEGKMLSRWVVADPHEDATTLFGALHCA